MTVRNRIAWPPTPEYLGENSVDIPDLVAWMLCGYSDAEAMSADRPTLSDQKHRHVKSIAEDFLHCVSSGRAMTPVTLDGKLTAGWDTQPFRSLAFVQSYPKGGDSNGRETHWVSWRWCHLHTSQHPTRCTCCHVLGQHWHQRRDSEWPWHYPLHKWNHHTESCSA